MKLLRSLVLAGAGLAALNRGPIKFDEKRKVTVSLGYGLSNKIIKKFPEYSKISPIVDHLFVDIGMTCMIASIYLGPP